MLNAVLVLEYFLQCGIVSFTSVKDLKTVTVNTTTRVCTYYIIYCMDEE